MRAQQGSLGAHLSNLGPGIFCDSFGCRIGEQLVTYFFCSLFLIKEAQEWLEESESDEEDDDTEGAEGGEEEEESSEEESEDEGGND